MELKGTEKLTALQNLSEQFGCDWVEYNEKIAQPLPILLKLGLEEMAGLGWFPRDITEDTATIITCTPRPQIAEDAKKKLGVNKVDFLVTLPHDLARIIDHNQDLNPGFPFEAGRTPLARVRTYLAGRRSLLAHYRTLLAKSRTGLGFIRTGLSCITIALLFLRILGGSWLLLLLEVPLLAMGCVMVFDGLKWYLPARSLKSTIPICTDTGATGGTTVLTADHVEDFPTFSRTNEIPGAKELRIGWTSMTPVMRRRYLASDRTDYAEERTVMACIRTHMAKARTGLAFIRTGIAFSSLGFGLVRHFHNSHWLAFDLTMIVIGAVMVAEGFFWYPSGRKAGIVGAASVKRSFLQGTIWDYFFPHRHFNAGPDYIPLTLPVKSSDKPGIWATTGVALERTVLAERRNVMSRLRTIMARGRTGFAFIRTGRSFIFIGLASILFFGSGSITWDILNWLMVGIGLFLVTDGLCWSLPAEKTRRQFPYCFGDMEITIPDYGVPARTWRKAVFSHE